MRSKQFDDVARANTAAAVTSGRVARVQRVRGVGVEGNDFRFADVYFQAHFAQVETRSS
jgi:hypothetical protein